MKKFHVKKISGGNRNLGGNFRPTGEKVGGGIPPHRKFSLNISEGGQINLVAITERKTVCFLANSKPYFFSQNEKLLFLQKQ